MEAAETLEKTIENQIVTFNLEDDDYGININHIKEIIEIPRITSVPNTPDYFEGIINLRGEILSVVNMRKRFDLKDIDRDEFARIIVSTIRGYRIGIVVDSVSEVLRLKDVVIQPPPPITRGVKEKFIRGMVEFEGENRIILLLDIDELVNEEDFKARDELKTADRDTAQAKEQKRSAEEVQMVTFTLDRENYGIEIHEVEEILNIPDVTPVPQAPDFIEGVISLRGKIIPLVNLRARFNLNAVEDVMHCSVIIVTISGVRVGLIVDDISEVLRVSKESIAPPPPNLTVEETNQIQGVVKQETSDRRIRLIMFLNLKNIFTKEIQDILGEMVIDDEGGAEDKEKEVEKNITIVTFQTGDDIFGIHIESVKEISTVPDITVVPRAPEFVEGVINLRGEVITVIDLRKRFGFEQVDKDEFSRITIVDIDGITTGLLVDQVRAVNTIPAASIESTPKIIEGVNTEFIEGVVKLSGEKKMLLMLNLQKILTESEKLEVFETTGDRRRNTEERRQSKQQQVAEERRLKSEERRQNRCNDEDRTEEGR